MFVIHLSLLLLMRRRFNLLLVLHRYLFSIAILALRSRRISLMIAFHLFLHDPDESSPLRAPYFFSSLISS